MPSGNWKLTISLPSVLTFISYYAKASAIILSQKEYHQSSGTVFDRKVSVCFKTEVILFHRSIFKFLKKVLILSFV